MSYQQEYTLQRQGYGNYPPQPQYPPQQKQQPQLQQNAVYPTTQMNPHPQAVIKENVVEGPREWNFGLFDCFSDLGLCNYHI